VNTNCSKADLVAEAHGPRDGFLARALASDNLDENDQCCLHGMHNEGPFGPGHLSGQPSHRKVGRRAPQQYVGADDRLDIPVTGRLDVGILDNRLHHRGAWRERSGEVIVCGHPANNLINGRGLHGADLG
jgi:hypothetical protein